MAPRGRRPDAAELGHLIWEHLRKRAASQSAEFIPDTRDGVTGWLWEGAVAALIREAVPGITDTDLRRAREYLNASGMVVNQRGGGQPLWFIRADWHQGPGGHVHVVSTGPPGQRAIPLAAPPPGEAETGEPAGRPVPDIAEALQLLAQQVSELQADNDRLREENDRLRGDNDRLRGDNDRLAAEIARIRARVRQAGELLAGTDGDPP
jgi:FtsZ-binding cell division protein ZapB